MKREYAAYECQQFLADIDKMINHRDEQLKEVAKQIVSKERIPPVAVFYQLKNQDGGEEILREVWMKAGGRPHDYNVLAALKLHKPEVNIEQLPEASWLLSIEFTLTSPYISQDDKPFYILDYPLRREWIFKVPYIAPSQWKGMLRASLSNRLAEEAKQLRLEEFTKKRFLLTVLFGDEKGEDEELPSCRGNLHFYPTYFNDETDFEIINPHSRTTGSGTVPFHLETVPAGTKGKVAVLYVPLYDAMPGSNAVNNAIESLRLVTQGMYDIFMCYGIGAKTSSGFGTVKTEEKINGNLRYHSPGASKKVPTNCSEQTEIVHPEYQPFFDENGQVKAIFLNPDGSFYSNKDYKLVSDEMGISLNMYKSFRRWYQQRKETGNITGGQDMPTEPGYGFSTLEEMMGIPSQLLPGKGE